MAGGDLELAVLVDPALATEQVVHAGCHLVVAVTVEPLARPHQLHVHKPFIQHTIKLVYLLHLLMNSQVGILARQLIATIPTNPLRLLLLHTRKINKSRDGRHVSICQDVILNYFSHT